MELLLLLLWVLLSPLLPPGPSCDGIGVSSPDRSNPIHHPEIPRCPPNAVVAVAFVLFMPRSRLIIILAVSPARMLLRPPLVSSLMQGVKRARVHKSRVSRWLAFSVCAPRMWGALETIKLPLSGYVYRIGA